jgi:hypothetical protein
VGAPQARWGCFSARHCRLATRAKSAETPSSGTIPRRSIAPIYARVRGWVNLGCAGGVHLEQISRLRFLALLAMLVYNMGKTVLHGVAGGYLPAFGQLLLCTASFWCAQDLFFVGLF